jgi:uncharacterized protein YhjY with autotransporter beta-barrel domain
MNTLFFGDRPSVSSGRVRAHVIRWLILTCLLMLGGVAQAANCPPVSITVASGGTATFDASNCAPFGLLGNSREPLHGTAPNNNNFDSIIHYTNNGDGAASDNFAVQDGEDGSIIEVTVTITQANPTVTTASLPAATFGAAYSQTLAASGGTAPYTWSLSGGALPTGLSVSAAGVISGTPTQAGAFSPTFTVTDSASRTGTKNLPLNVAAPTITVSPATLPGGTVGAAYSQTATASGGTAPYTWQLASGALPAGLTLSAAGVLSGTPTSSASVTFTLRATDSSTGTGAPFSGQRSYTVAPAAPTITIAPVTLPAGQVGQAYSGTLTASGGTAPYTFNVSAGALPPGLSMSSAGVLSGQPTTAGTFNVTIAATDSSTGAGAAFTAQRAYSITISAPTITVTPATLPALTVGAAYSQTIAASGGTAPYTFAVTAGSLPAGITLATNGTLSGTATAAGSFSVTLRATDAGGNPGTRSYTFTVNAPTVAVAPAALPNGTVGQTYSNTITASGGTAPYNFSVSAGTLPAGLSLSSAGVLSGQLTTAGSYNFTVNAADSSTGAGAPFSGQRSYTVTANAASIMIAPATLPAPVVGADYAQTLTASGGVGPYAFAVTAGAFPAGVSLGASGALTGRPTVAGTFNVTVRATDSFNSTGNRAYSFTVGAPTLAITPASQPDAHVGQAYSATFTTSGGTAPYTYAATTALPPGLTLASNGTLSGTPTQGGSFAITIRSTDSTTGAGAPFATSLNTTLVIDADPLVLSPTNPALTATYGVANSITFTTSGGSAPRSLALTGALPTGMTFDAATGVLSGTPTVSGSFPLTVTATDSSATPVTTSRAYTLTIAGPTIALTPATLPAATAGQAYSQPIAATGGVSPYSFAATGALPAGVTLASDGTLAGTPASAGSFNVTVIATDRFGSTGSHAYTLTVNTGALSVTPATQPTAHVGQAYTASFSTTGGVAPYSYAVTSGALPAGLALASNGTLSGTPTQAGSFPVSIRATDSTGGSGPASSTLNTTLTVDADPLVLLPASPALTATYGVNSSIAFTSSGGSAPRTLSLTGALPAGMSFSAASGLLSGTPTVTGSFPLTVAVTDSSATPVTTSRAYTLTIAAVTVTLAPATLPNGIVGTAYSASLSANGGVGPYAFTVSAGALPQGLALSTTGAITGTPTRSGPATATVRATDANGMTGSLAYTVTVGDAAPVAVADTARTPANQAITIPVAANDSGVSTSVSVASTPAHGAATADGTSIRYTPAADFFGTDTFTYIATGPGGNSNAATVTVDVQAGALPVVPDQAVATLAGQTVTVNAVAGASGGPFTTVTIVSAPASGTATVSGTNIAYTAPVDANGMQRFTYTVTNVFGVSQPVTVSVTVQPRPVAIALSATVAAGQTVQVDLTGSARGGPFTEASVVSLSPAQSGNASIVKTATGYRLDFAAAAAFSGQAQLVYTIANAYATSQPATVTITVTSRPDPTKDPEVTGILGAQVDATRRMATGQIANFQQRLESLHGPASSRFNNGLSFSSGGGRTRTDPGMRNGKGVAEAMTNPDGPAFLGPGGQNASAGTNAAATGDTSSPDDVAFWTGGAVNFGSTDRGAATNGVDFTTSGVSFGADKRLSNALALGLGVGYGHDSSDIGKMGSHSKATAYNMAVYASLRPSESTYIDTLVGYQWLDFDARRYVTADGGRVTGSRNGKQAFGSIAIGYEHESGITRLTPYGRLDVARAQLDGYTERGDSAYALDYHGQKVRTSTGALGLRAEFRLKRDFGTLVPRVRVEYQRDFQGSSDATMTYADLLSGPLYRTSVGDSARNHRLLGLGAQAQFNNGLSLRMEYQALFDSGTHANQSILLGIEKTF